MIRCDCCVNFSVVEMHLVLITVEYLKASITHSTLDKY